MQISIRRTGGFGGITSTVDVDTHDLPPDEARTIEEMIQRLDFFNLPPRFAPSRSVRDSFEYEIVVRQAGREYAVLTTDTAGPDELQQLVQRLMAQRRHRNSSQQGDGGSR